VPQTFRQFPGHRRGQGEEGDDHDDAYHGDQEDHGQGGEAEKPKIVDLHPDAPEAGEFLIEAQGQEVVVE